MYWTRLSRSTRTLLYSLSCLSIVALALWFGASTNSVDASSERNSPEEDTFPGMIPGGGAIPDGSGDCGDPAASNLDVTFNVVGITDISNVEVDITMEHTWLGDVSATLIAPSGETHTIFQNIGWTDATSACGDSSNLDDTYVFNDMATANIWEEALAIDGISTVAGGNYRTIEAGGDTQTQDPAPATSIDAAFASTATPNGTWTLRFNDSGPADTGSVSAANLTFNSMMGGTIQPPPNDFDGDGISDYSIVRNEPTPFSGNPDAPKARRSIQELATDRGFKPLQLATGNAPETIPGTDLKWYIHNSGSNTARIDGFGDPNTDFWIPEDFDGDGEDDVAVWRGIAPSGPMGGAFYIFQSSDSSVVEIDFGIAGDNPTVSGDYDGDGTSDPAVFRCPPGGGQCSFFYRGSAGGGEITFFDWGNDSANEDLVFPYPGDFDGDGQFDFCVWDDNAVYNLFRTSDGGTEFIQWGLTTDAVIAPGDYDGDGRTDFMNVRVNGSDVEWWLLERDGGQNTVVWGALIAGFAEFVAQGDFDGDGATDITVWRRDENSNSNSFFYTLRSSDLMLQTFEWGSMNDAPVPGWNSQ